MKAIIVIGILIIAGGIFYALKNNNDPEPQVMNEEEGMMMNMKGIHIMADGRVMNGDGEIMHDATVHGDGMVELGNGQLVKPEMDMRVQ